MVEPCYDTSCIDTHLKHLLTYTRAGHRSDDPIELALVQIFSGKVTIPDIMLKKKKIHQIFTNYEATNGNEIPISLGQRINLTFAALYAQYRYNQYKPNGNSHDPDQCTLEDYKEW